MSISDLNGSEGEYNMGGYDPDDDINMRRMGGMDGAEKVSVYQFCLSIYFYEDIYLFIMDRGTLILIYVLMYIYVIICTVIHACLHKHMVYGVFMVQKKCALILCMNLNTYV